MDENTEVVITNKLDLGHFYSLMSLHCGFEDEEGKFMGYQSYGKFDEKIYSLLKKGITEEEIEKLPTDNNVAHTSQIWFFQEVQL